MRRLGIDIGAYSIKIVLFSETNQVIKKSYIPHHNKVKALLKKELNEYLNSDEEVILGVTGSMTKLLGLAEKYVIFEKKALLKGLEAIDGEFNSAVIIGAQKTYYCTQRQVKRNSNCSAGTGAFFEEQASRLQIPLESISETVGKAESIPQIAGRCSVFSKTDMIHRMQEGTKTPDILNGLCYALVRNYKSGILSNKEVEKPVFLAGGVMKNAGVVAALKDLFSLDDKDFILDRNADYIFAFGAAMLGEYTISLDELLNLLDENISVVGSSKYPPLKDFVREDDKKDFKLYPYIAGEAAYLGIDVGSTSTNFVVLNEKRQMVYFSYVKTLGKPYDVVQEEFKKLKNAILDLKLNGIAVTGSGREYIGKELNATLVINEITAQTEGALVHYPKTETIFEIGGQDSKYMEVSNHKMVDFEMNKVCAAGTGAFLEEQIKKLGISMDEFLDYAMRSEHPCELGDRCTVFIEGSINRRLAEGNSMEDVCAGLAYAIVSNYLNRVVNQKKIGDSIALQGGIAYNEAVVCAFRALTGKEIHTSEYFSVTGALGAASLAMNKASLHFDKEKNQLLNKKLLEASENSYLKDYAAPLVNSNKKRIGIPRVIFLHKMFPLFNTMFTMLGFDVIISPLTTDEIVKLAEKNVSAEVCYPIKLIYGHVAWLLEQGVDYILLPRLYTIKHEGSVARKDYACMYMQTSPLLMEQAFSSSNLRSGKTKKKFKSFKDEGVTLLMPELSLEFGKKFMVKSLLSMAPELGIPKIKMIPAAVKGFSKLVAHGKRLESIGKEVLEGDEPIFVLVSRVYNIIDPVLNMGIEKYLNDCGCRVVHLEHLEASYMNVEHDYKDLYWPFGQHILTGLKLIKANKNLYPIYITNHGCGPDTALQHFFMNEMDGREYLQLEVDEHSSKVGVITRLEAFLYSLQPQEAVPLKNQSPQKHNEGALKKIGFQKDNVGSQNNIGLKNFEADYSLIPDFGIYSDVMEKYLPENHAPIVRVAPLVEHHPFNYAMNKEYFSMQVFLEEILGTVHKDKTYDFYCPIDEGSEVFGQYALLTYQELTKLGYKINLKTFFLEDLIKRDDYLSIFEELISVESVEANRVLELANKENKKASMILGEPLCVYKKAAGNKGALAPALSMPFSEALLFHMKMIDRDGKLTSRIQRWECIHDSSMRNFENCDLYTSIELLNENCKGKLDFMIGNFSKYRFGKLMSLDQKNTRIAYIINSSEENASIVLKSLVESHCDEVPVEYQSFDLDFEHNIVKEEII